MITEIEVKILEINRAQVEEKLASLGAIKVFDDEIHARYYDLPDQRLKSSGITLRLRKEGPKAVVTLKMDVANPAAKERKEHETAVGDFEVMRTILESMGFVAWLEMKKHRTSYELGNVHFELDRYYGKYSHIPEFLEIEGRDMETVFRHAEALGFGRHECRPWDAVGLAAYYAGRDSRS
jgi:predicted adenylyl cyclase CyaB